MALEEYRIESAVCRKGEVGLPYDQQLPAMLMARSNCCDSPAEMAVRSKAWFLQMGRSTSAANWVASTSRSSADLANSVDSLKSDAPAASARQRSEFAAWFKNQRFWVTLRTTDGSTGRRLVGGWAPVSRPLGHPGPVTF